ncbi:hypothetical protein BaRGS_00005072, partial [Batillaria attramentaria]
DLLPKCDHHNSRVRLTGVEGVTELMTVDQDTVLIDMSGIFKRVLPLLSDRDPLVRQAVLKLFRMVFANGEARKIAGFFPLLSTHLCCAMTHICDDVQQDSLQFFDLLLDKFPMEVTGNMSQLLIQIFIEQISTQAANAGSGASKGRTLVVNPSSRQSSQKVRAKILERLKKLVNAFLERDMIENAPSVDAVPVVFVSEYPTVREPLVPQWVRRMWRSPYLSLDLSSDPNFKDNEYAGMLMLCLLCISPNFKDNEYAGMLMDGEKLQKFMELLLPLLKQCWAEVCPSSSGAHLLDQTDQKLTLKSLPLLTSVVGVLHALVQCWVCLCKHKEKSNSSRKFPLTVSERMHHSQEGQSTKLSTVQVSVLKLNLSIVEIMAAFPAAGRDGSGSLSDTKVWQATLVTFMLDHIGHCSGADLGKTVTSVLQKMFLNFIPSKKLDKLVKRVHSQYSKAHPLSAEKRMYLAVLEALAYDDCSPYKDRLELLHKFFNSLPDLLLQLPRGGVQTAEAVIKIMQRGGRKNCRPFISVIRQNVERLFDAERGVLAASDPSIHEAACHLVYWLFRMDPPSSSQLKLFAQNCRLPQVSVSVAKTLISTLDITFWHLNYDKAVALKPHQPQFMTFLTGIISGHTKEEIEALQLSKPPHVLSLLGIVWNCSSEQLDRHAAIFECCKVRFRGYLKPSVMLGVMQGVWSTKVINVHRWHSVCTAYGILHHWADMVMLALPSGDMAHVDRLPTPEEQHSAKSNEEQEAVESVKLHLHDFARLCLSLAFDIVSVETVGETDAGSPKAEVVQTMWQTVLHVCSASLRMLVMMCQLMTRIVKEGDCERDTLIVIRLTTRLLQTDDLLMECCPTVSAHQWWSDLTYAMDVAFKYMK